MAGRKKRKAENKSNGDSDIPETKKQKDEGGDDGRMSGSMEIGFAKRLAANEKKVRDKTIKVLKMWLSQRKGFSQDDFLKLWKGLFYCFWMSDKVVIQQELATKISQLVHCLTFDDAAVFLKSTWMTLSREWGGIDSLRLDKFYSLVRKCIRESLLYQQNSGWDADCTSVFGSILTDEVLAQHPNGLRFHVVDLFMDEMPFANDAALDALLKPFYCTMGKCDKVLFKRIVDSIFDPLLDEQFFVSKKKVGQHACLKNVSAQLFEIASSPDLELRNRNNIYDLRKKFQVASDRVAADAASDEAATATGPAEDEMPAVTPTKKKTKKRKNRKSKSNENTPTASEADTAREEAPATPISEVEVASPVAVEAQSVAQKKKKKRKTAPKAATTPVPASPTESRNTKGGLGIVEEDVAVKTPKGTKKKNKKLKTPPKSAKKSVFFNLKENVAKTYPQSVKDLKTPTKGARTRSATRSASKGIMKTPNF